MNAGESAQAILAASGAHLVAARVNVPKLTRCSATQTRLNCGAIGHDPSGTECEVPGFRGCVWDVPVRRRRYAATARQAGGDATARNLSSGLGGPRSPVIVPYSRGLASGKATWTDFSANPRLFFGRLPIWPADRNSRPGPRNSAQVHDLTTFWPGNRPPF